MYQHILVPLDGSDLGEQVLPYVRLLGKALSIPVELLRIVDVSVPYMADFAHLPQSGQPDSPRVTHAEQYVEKVAVSLREQGLKVSSSVMEVLGDTPASQIIVKAEQNPGTLIAMTTHGRSGLTRWALGSVTDKVLHATSNPLLVVRTANQIGSPTQARISKVIIPLDGSVLAEQVLPYAVPLAKVLGANVSLLRVIPSSLEFCSYMEYPDADYENLAVTQNVQAIEYLKEVADQLRQQGVASVEERLAFGNPPSAITELAQEIPDSLVSMTTHGRSGISRWALGSVANRVVRHSGGPVLVIRATTPGT